MLTSKIIASAPQKPKVPEYPSLWRSEVSGAVWLMSDPTSGVCVVKSPEDLDSRVTVGTPFMGRVPIHELSFERLDGPLTVEFSS